MARNLLGALCVLVPIVASSATQAQVIYDQYGNRHDYYSGTTTSNPMFGSSAPSYSTGSLPSVPDPSSGIGRGSGPYGTSAPTGPSGYPCAMPGCR